MSSRAAAADAMLGSVRNGALPSRSPGAGAGPRAPGGREPAAPARPQDAAPAGSGAARRVRAGACPVGGSAGRGPGGTQLDQAGAPRAGEKLWGVRS